MKKKIYLLALLITLLLIGVYAVGESFISPEIEPFTDDKINICFEVKVTVVATGNEKSKSFCRKYPTDLLNHCDYGRYGQVIGECKNILKKEVKRDLKNWYKLKLPKEIKQKVTLKDLTVTSISYEPYQNWVGCKYDFLNEDIVC